MMQFTNLHWSRTQVETLMDVTSTLADHTGSPELCAKIPDYLSRALSIEPITLAVIETPRDGNSSIKFIASGEKVSEEAKTSEHILELFRQTRPLTATDGPMLRYTVSNGASENASSDLAVKNTATLPRAMVVGCAIDEKHRLLLVVHLPAMAPQNGAANTNMLGLIAGHLAKLLRCLVAWQERPEALGGPFTRLTDREWTVLRALNSDDGEKQLADRLHLSPHTLHSHIKSIYRKVGVQGRLPLLQQLNEALLKLRVTTVNMRAAGLACIEERSAAVAVG